jgi:two-component system, NarL family, response regulator LiaR
VSRSARRTAVVVDYHVLWLRWLERALKQAGLTVLAGSTSLDHGPALAREHVPDLLVVGSERPFDDVASIDELVALRTSLPELRVVLVSSSRRDSAIAAALNVADAYCLRSARSDDLITAVRQAFERSIFLPLRPQAQPARCRTQHLDDPRSSLTPREREILALVSEGRTNPEVARLLWLTEQTVKFHLHNVYRKLEVPNRVEAARWAHAHDVVTVARAVADAPPSEAPRPSSRHSPPPVFLRTHPVRRRRASCPARRSRGL